MSGTSAPERGSRTQDRELGHRAEAPKNIPPRGWWQVTRRSLREVGNDHISMIAKGVAFSWFLALFPGLIAAVSIYGLVTSPSEVEAQVTNLASSLPASAQELITNQLRSLASASSGALTVGLVVSIALLLLVGSEGKLLARAFRNAPSRGQNP